MDRWMDEWMDRWMDKWSDGQIAVIQQGRNVPIFMPGNDERMSKTNPSEFYSRKHPWEVFDF